MNIEAQPDIRGVLIQVALALEITILPDAAPDVIVTFPGRDTIISPDLRQIVAADARDELVDLTDGLVLLSGECRAARDLAHARPDGAQR